MPPPLILTPDELSPDTVLATGDQIYASLPQRYEFQLLHGATRFDPEKGVGVAFAHIRDGDWWTRGHIPGRPLFPGILMLEAGAQAAAFLISLVRKDNCFMGFGGVESCKFRGSVTPPATMYFVCRLVENRPRRFIGDVQGLVNGELVFEARITGLAMTK